MSADRELVLTRLINAPRAKVYRAWTDPALLKQWVAPKPYTTPIVEIDAWASAELERLNPDRLSLSGQPRRDMREEADRLYRRIIG